MRSLLLATTLLPALAFAGEWEDQALTRLQEAMPMILEASWAQRGSLWLFVTDNGQSRDGLATAACLSLQMYEGQPERDFVIIRVYDAASALTGQGSDLLGYGECSL